MSLTPEQIAELLPFLKCRECGKPISGLRTDFCSDKCKNRFHQNNSYQAQQTRGLERKLLLIKAKGGGCGRCGYNKNSAALDFHHRDASKKRFKLDMRNMSNRALRTLLEEVNKCDRWWWYVHTKKKHPLRVFRVGRFHIGRISYRVITKEENERRFS